MYVGFFNDNYYNSTYWGGRKGGNFGLGQSWIGGEVKG